MEDVPDKDSANYPETQVKTRIVISILRLSQNKPYLITDFWGVRFPEMYSPRRAGQRTFQNVFVWRAKS